MSQIIVRHIAFEFPETINRFWLGNDPFKTHLLNSLTLFLPEVEKYIIRTVKPELRKIENAKLKQEVSQFVAQEGQHSIAHTKFWQNLNDQGYKLKPYFQFIAFVLNNIFRKHFSQTLNLAIIAGFEHLTECLSELGLEQNLLAEAPPELRLLFEWHAAEELEHKTIAYDVLLNSSQHYLIRLLGLLISHIFFVVFIGLGLVMLLKQDRKLLDFRVWRSFIHFAFVKERFVLRATASFVRYLRLDFHPSQRKNQFLCQQVFAHLSEHTIASSNS